MDMMSSIAAMSMDMSAAKLQTDYSMALTGKVMELQEVALEAITEMMPTPAPAMGQYIDTYA